VSAPVDSLPKTALVPDHAPDAVQKVAFVEDQVRVEDPPLVTDVGFAASDTVGGVDPPEPAGADSASPAPPQAAHASAIRGTNSNVFSRNIAVPIA